MPFKLYYFFSSFLISILCPRLISDSRAIQEYYKKTFKKPTYYIPYGIPKISNISLEDQEIILREMGLDKKKYFLQITRIEPDNLPVEISKVFRDSCLVQKGFKFVVIGYKDDTSYALELKALSNSTDILVLPANYDPSVLYAIRNNCFCYIHGNSVGGTNPALLEAMATCPRILAIDVPFSRDVLGEYGSFFSMDNLIRAFQNGVILPDQRSEMKKRAQNLYQWDAVADSYMAIVEDHDPTYRPKITKGNENGN